MKGKIGDLPELPVFTEILKNDFKYNFWSAPRGSYNSSFQLKPNAKLKCSYCNNIIKDSNLPISFEIVLRVL
jgi:hypothetical protein